MFTEYLNDMSKEQGERFRLNIKIREDRYQGRWDIIHIQITAGTYKETA